MRFFHGHTSIRGVVSAFRISRAEFLGEGGLGTSKLSAFGGGAGVWVQ